MEQSLLKSDVFFFVTTIVVVVIGVVWLIAGVYIIRILHIFRKISQMIHDESTEVRKDLDDIRQTVRTKGAGFSVLKKIFTTINKRRK
ncbi:MAG TPA: hypothetical protein VEA59_04015 [Patescibacteria group bacterium]|nr:hypothetical protein [Patescibacteria group bacterium]